MEESFMIDDLMIDSVSNYNVNPLFISLISHIKTYMDDIKEKEKVIDDLLDEEIHYVKKVRSSKNIRLKILKTALKNFTISLVFNSMVFVLIHTFLPEFKSLYTAGSIVGMFAGSTYYDIRIILENAKKEIIDNSELEYYENLIKKAKNNYDNSIDELILFLNELKKDYEIEYNNKNFINENEQIKFNNLLKLIDAQIEYQNTLKEEKSESIKLKLEKNNIPY